MTLDLSSRTTKLWGRVPVHVVRSVVAPYRVEYSFNKINQYHLQCRFYIVFDFRSCQCHQSLQLFSPGAETGNRTPTLLVSTLSHFSPPPQASASVWQIPAMFVGEKEAFVFLACEQLVVQMELQHSWGKCLEKCFHSTTLRVPSVRATGLVENLNTFLDWNIDAVIMIQWSGSNCSREKLFSISDMTWTWWSRIK